MLIEKLYILKVDDGFAEMSKYINNWKIDYTRRSRFSVGHNLSTNTFRVPSFTINLPAAIVAPPARKLEC